MSAENPTLLEEALFLLGVFCHHTKWDSNYTYRPVRVEFRRGTTRGSYLVCAVCGIVDFDEVMHGG